MTYVEKIEFENVGPLAEIFFDFPFSENNNPKPVILVGKNGAGKSIFISHIVNAFLSAKQKIYNNTEVEVGRVYKLRSPSYISKGQRFSFSQVSFLGGLYTYEWALNRRKNDYEATYNSTPIRKQWTSIPKSETTHLVDNFREKEKELEELVDNGCLLYFPANRFEEPAWLNIDNLLSRPVNSQTRRISGVSNRWIICQSPLTLNQNWIFDIILDRELDERQIRYAPLSREENAPRVPLFVGYEGPATKIWEQINRILNLILNTQNRARFGIRTRNARELAIMVDEAEVSQVFQLSTGQTSLLNLFISIVRDFDLCNGTFESLEEIKGIVVVDEIETHLHTVHQYEILPKLIKMFPKVQFIISAHSPLFVLGMEREFGKGNLEILELPAGEKIGSEMFSEFEDAYNAFLETNRLRESISAQIETSNKPILFVEGILDIKYLKKAAEALGREATLNKIIILNAEGYGNLDGIWQSRKHLKRLIEKKEIILLYDCDKKRSNEESDFLIRRGMPYQEDNIIKTGIENLLPTTIISKAMSYKDAFFDITEETKRTLRGVSETIPRSISVNDDEKSNLCDWICENGTKEDFLPFTVVFDLLDEILD